MLSRLLGRDCQPINVFRLSLAFACFEHISEQLNRQPFLLNTLDVAHQFRFYSGFLTHHYLQKSWTKRDKKVAFYKKKSSTNI